MTSKEAKSRIKINKLLEESGWRFFDNELGEDFDKIYNGFIAFLSSKRSYYYMVISKWE